MNNNTGILNAVPSHMMKMNIVFKSMIIKFLRNFCFWYGKSVVSNKLLGERSGLGRSQLGAGAILNFATEKEPKRNFLDFTNYGPSIIMCPP